MQVGPRCHPRGITGFGNPESRVVILGIAPGPEEIVKKRPFVGPSGRLLDSILEAVGWSREQVYCTNLICWYNNSPSIDDIQACRPRLESELANLKPKLIVMMGSIVTEAFTGESFGKMRGAVQWQAERQCYTLATYHPAGILRGGEILADDLIRDLAKIPDIISNWPEDGSVCAEVKYYVVQSHEEAQRALDELALTGFPVAVDVETDSADVNEIHIFEDRLLCFALSIGKMTYVIPAQFAQGLRWPEAKWIFHNGAFDTQVLRRHLGIKLTIGEDTMLQSYTLDERSGMRIHGLKMLAREYCGAGFYEEEKEEFRKRRLGEMPPDKLYKYNAKDAAYTERLYYKLGEMQQADGVRDFYHRLLIPAANAFAEINYRGVYIDEERMEQLALEWFPRYLAGEDELVQMAADEGYINPVHLGLPLNLRSPKQLSFFLFDQLGLPGGPSTAADVLEELKGRHPFIDKLLAYRHLDHMVGTYILGIKDDIKVDGRVHPKTLLHGTVTGRTSYKEPPLQTIPKEYTLGDDYGRIREIFAATNDNYVIVEADYEKAEVYMAYAHSKDPQLLADLESGDYHTTVATAIFKVPRKEVTKLMRYKTKFVTFGIMYDRGAESLAYGELQCSIEEAQQYIDNWFARYPVYAQWREDIKEQATKTGELVSIFGRKRRFKYQAGPRAHKILAQAVNFPIQSATSDYKLSSLIKLHDALRPYDSYILFEVHDSLIMEVRKRYLQEVLTLVKDTMEAPQIEGGPAIPIELKIGPRWGGAKEVE